MKDNIRYYKLAFSMVKPYKRHYALLILVKAMILGLSLITPFIYMVYINDVMKQMKVEWLPYILLAYAAVFLMNTILLILAKYLYNHIFFKLNLKLQRKMVKQYIQTSNSTINKYDIGDLKTRLISDIDIISKYLTTYSIDIALTVLFVIVVVVIMFSLLYILAFCVLLVIPLSFVFTNFLGNKSAIFSNEYRKQYGEYEGLLYDTINHWREIKINTIEDIALDRVKKHLKRLASLTLKIQLISFFNKVFMRFKDFFLTQMSLYFIGGLLIFNGNLTVGVLVSFMSYFALLLSNVTTITEFILNLKNEKPIIERVWTVLTWSTEGGITKQIPESSLNVENVSFQYPENELTVLHHVSCHFQPRENVAIVGKSGCGKSTLAKLLVRLYEPTEGSITIGGIGLQNITSDCLRRKINIVMQKPYMFNMTIRENLLLAKSNASDSELIQACKQAYIYELIQNRPEGLDTVVGENGAKLSGGQLQRLSIARIILLNPDIIIFDEATSSLDTQSEQQIINAIDDLSSSKTIISIAHRYSTIASSDRVIVMEQGKIVGMGSHSELRGKVSVYDDLFAEQYIVEG